MTASKTFDRCPRTGVALPECSCWRCCAVLLREHGHHSPPAEFDRRKPPLVDGPPSVKCAGGPSNG